MLTITLPSDLEATIVEAAKRQGSTPQELAVASLTKLYSPGCTPQADVGDGGSLADFLRDHIGTVDGSSEPWSEKTGERFSDLIHDQPECNPS